MLKAVTLDFWGTLVDAHHDLSDERIDFLAGYIREYPRERVAEAYQDSARIFLQALHEGMGLRAATMLSMTLDRLGATLTPPEYEMTLRFWEEALLVSPPRILDGACEVLRELRARGFFVALISDTGLTPGVVVRRMLQERGLLAMFDWLTFSSDTGVTKKTLYAFTGTLRALGVAPQHALHVGDTETDVRGAHAAGMRAALVLESSGHREVAPLADLVLPRLQDLCSALQEMIAASTAAP
ncbi:MAG TPA: HAD family hydrolase [Chloroflexi bacterium]|jgi:HAD superfamily hydrolase (TIGR01509 family)|nr:HAD family hydrolase [Chloroflexota bacterium]